MTIKSTAIVVEGKRLPHESPYYDIAMPCMLTYEMIERLRSAGCFYISDEFLAEVRAYSEQRLPPHERGKKL